MLQHLKISSSTFLQITKKRLKKIIQEEVDRAERLSNGKNNKINEIKSTLTSNKQRKRRGRSHHSNVSCADSPMHVAAIAKHG